jgi:hypothetical protein
MDDLEQLASLIQVKDGDQLQDHEYVPKIVEQCRDRRVGSNLDLRFFESRRPKMIGAGQRWCSRTSVIVAAATLFAGAAVMTASPAQARPTQVCIPVRANGTGQDQGAGPDGNLHTTATISVGTIPIGTTNATFTPDGSPAGTQLGFTGPIVFTPRFGPATLTANVSGSVDLVAGTFVASSTSITGTGNFSSLTGQLTFSGKEDLTTGAFTETITGRLCAPRH